MTPERWQKIEQLCHAALEREAYQRGAFLEEACRGDNELLIEVESLLAQEKTAEGFLGSASAEVAANVWTKMQGENGGQRMIGRRLGSYEVGSLLGVGGMGEVYQAHDTKLGRDMAIKVLPSIFVHDPDRAARFEREARMLAQLNHPNIATIHGLEQSNGIHFLIMELVPGETLADRIKRDGGVPVEEALGIAKQIAEALEAAHEKAIVHRDLKPANIKVTPEGKIIVLDFGLAKAFTGDATDANPANSPTISDAATWQGMILGTAAYMSPEQARGKVVDKRTDIWAFGCVLYELLSGTHAFPGADITEILAAVIKSEPDWSRLPGNTPSAIRALLGRCLQKDKTLRMRDAGDARIEIQEALAAPRDADGTTSVPAWKSKLSWIAAPVLLAGFAVLAFVHFRVTPPTVPVLQLSVPFPPNSLGGYAVLSPDGRRLVVMVTIEDKWLLSIRSLDSADLRLLPGTEFARGPFWSPDSKSIGFFVDGKLKIMSADGGPPEVLCEGAGQSASGTWNREGVILFSSIAHPIHRVNASGGACTSVTNPEGDSKHSSPEFLPDGKHFVYVVTSGNEAGRGLYVASLDNPTSRRLFADVSSARFVPSTTGKKYGYLLFIRGHTLMAQPFNSETLELAGDAIRVATEASFTFSFPSIGASASADGTLAYLNHIFVAKFQLTWMDRSGKELATPGSVQGHRDVLLSPDAKTAATVRWTNNGNDGIWLEDFQHGGETRFTSADLTGAPVWSPEGKWIAFGSGKGLYLKDASGEMREEPLLENENTKAVSDWSHDGRYLIYTENDAKGRGDIWYLEDPLSKSSEHRPVKFQGTEGIESQGQLSLDGRWLAYTSDESGQYDIYVRPFPTGPGRWKISVGRGLNREPRWRRDGKELFYLETTQPFNRLMAVPIESGSHGEFQAGTPQALFEFRAGPTVATSNYFLYSPSADGRRFMVIVQAGDDEPTLNVVTNWEKAALGSN